MCVKVIINLGEKELETPRQFKRHFGFSCSPQDNVDASLEDLCLCGWHIEEALQINKIPFKSDGDDIYVGKLVDYKQD